MYCPTILRISLGMVAENNHVFFESGVYSRMVSSSSLKPMLSISSASSKIKWLIWSKCTAFLLIKSINRPGVAMTTWRGDLSSRIWVTMLAPP